MKVLMSAKIEESILNEFRTLVTIKYGKLRGNFQQEAENAILSQIKLLKVKSK